MTNPVPGRPDAEDHRRFDPERWRELGFSRESGRAWFTHRIEPRDALRWQRAEVTEPIDAVRWRIAGIGPDTVREWVYAKIDAREAVAWTELGFNVAAARKHKRAGRSAVQAYGHDRRVSTAVTYPAASQAGVSRIGVGHRRFMEAVRGRDPRVMHSYMQRQWFDDEAIAWATHGIEAADALAWKELGLTPVEVECYRAREMSPMQTAKAWWRAGIPFDEVADWIGAGLSPEEAAQQRANGVTAERAAVLRSLRKNR
ncbi:MAG TPA: hypothetical protein VME22_06765 [Solirubrobacteraceae bacterium]|nr:hypothetical protein [Solirubrobacteraceae bacterium]